MIYQGTIQHLIDIGYHPNIYYTYYFKTISRYGAIFIDIKTREVDLPSDVPNKIVKELNNDGL